VSLEISKGLHYPVFLSDTWVLNAEFCRRSWIFEGVLKLVGDCGSSTICSGSLSSEVLRELMSMCLAVCWRNFLVSSGFIGGKYEKILSKSLPSSFFAMVISSRLWSRASSNWIWVTGNPSRSLKMRLRLFSHLSCHGEWWKERTNLLAVVDVRLLHRKEQEAQGILQDSFVAKVESQYRQEVIRICLSN